MTNRHNYYQYIYFLIVSLGLLFFFFKTLPHLLWGVMIDTWFISKGLIMYRDFFSSHFPLTTYFSLPFDVLFKWNTQTGSILSLMISFGTLLLIFKTTRQFLSPFTSGLAMLNYSLLYYYFSTAIQISEEAILGLLITLIFYNISSCLQKDSFTTAKIMLIGFLVGLTEMFGQISTTILITITLFFIFLIIKKQKKLNFPKISLFWY